jgi:hypothetical protein
VQAQELTTGFQAVFGSLRGSLNEEQSYWQKAFELASKGSEQGFERLLTLFPSDKHTPGTVEVIDQMVTDFYDQLVFVHMPAHCPQPYPAMSAKERFWAKLLYWFVEDEILAPLNFFMPSTLSGRHLVESLGMQHQGLVNQDIIDSACELLAKTRCQVCDASQMRYRAAIAVRSAYIEHCSQHIAKNTVQFLRQLSLDNLADDVAKQKPLPASAWKPLLTKTLPYAEHQSVFTPPSQRNYQTITLTQMFTFIGEAGKVVQ